MHERIDLRGLANIAAAGGLTSRQIAVRIGLSQPQVWRLINGRARDMSAHAFSRLVRLAGGSIHLPDGMDAAPPPSDERDPCGGGTEAADAA